MVKSFFQPVVSLKQVVYVPGSAASCRCSMFQGFFISHQLWEVRLKLTINHLEVSVRGVHLCVGCTLKVCKTACYNGASRWKLRANDAKLFAKVNIVSTSIK